MCEEVFPNAVSCATGFVVDAPQNRQFTFGPEVIISWCRPKEITSFGNGIAGRLILDRQNPTQSADCWINAVFSK